MKLAATVVVGFISAVTLSMAHAGTETPPATSAASQAQWSVYRNPATGLSFRYPPTLRIRERDARSFGLQDVEAVIELRGDTKLNLDTVVLRFLVKRGEKTPEMAAAKARAERARYATYTDSRYSITTMELDGHDALVEVSCGARGPACHWSVNILQPRDCVILTLNFEPIEDSFAPPHDGAFPLLGIIRTVHFDAPAK